MGELRLPELGDRYNAAETYVETQAHILQDEGFVEKVVTSLGADRHVEALRGPGLVTRISGLLGLKSSPRTNSSHDAAVGAAAKNLAVHSSSASHVVELTFDAAEPQTMGISEFRPLEQPICRSNSGLSDFDVTLLCRYVAGFP